MIRRRPVPKLIQPCYAMKDILFHPGVAANTSSYPVQLYISNKQFGRGTAHTIHYRCNVCLGYRGVDLFSGTPAICSQW